MIQFLDAAYKHLHVVHEIACCKNSISWATRIRETASALKSIVDRIEKERWSYNRSVANQGKVDADVG